MITWSIKLRSHMWHYVLSRIWRNLHRDIGIDRNRIFEELLKLGGGQKIFIFRRGEGLLYEGKIRKFSFSRGSRPMRVAVNFLGGLHTPLHTMSKRFTRAFSKHSKMHSGNLSQIVLPNIWLLVLINHIISLK